MEEEINAYWQKIDAFKKSLKFSEGRPEFNFYDGPPFATGQPHYGHLLAGTIKDVVTRFAHQTGHYVERRFGWDTHGLPVECVPPALSCCPCLRLPPLACAYLPKCIPLSLSLSFSLGGNGLRSCLSACAQFAQFARCPHPPTPALLSPKRVLTATLPRASTRAAATPTPAQV